MDKIKDTVKKTAKKAAMGARRMTVIIFCVVGIAAIDIVHAVLMEPMTAGTITAITLIAALGGVDVWKNRPKAP
ncbi:MAG: hypothetical protein V3U75_11675 [Methylococcaceae bacterium]